MRSWMDEIYGVFKGHVTAIRGNRLKKPIDELAGGRVYTGKQALELGLVDRLGTLHDAIKFVADAGQARPTTTSASFPSPSRSSNSSWTMAATTAARAWTWPAAARVPTARAGPAPDPLARPGLRRPWSARPWAGSNC